MSETSLKDQRLALDQNLFTLVNGAAYPMHQCPGPLLI